MLCHEQTQSSTSAVSTQYSPGASSIVSLKESPSALWCNLWLISLRLAAEGTAFVQQKDGSVEKGKASWIKCKYGLCACYRGSTGALVLGSPTRALNELVSEERERVIELLAALTASSDIVEQQRCQISDLKDALQARVSLATA